MVDGATGKDGAADSGAKWKGVVSSCNGKTSACATPPKKSVISALSSGR